ncbi:acyl-CoA thioesterase [Roseateles aquatilis]|uniref:Acyl-CoA thioesterase n=1 Tax=Roseateles aquatilis TaxID=431061 RepID=A0A246IZF9_9BURK|nr:thioesterase family protein [Roseateles aquatilis]OWQ85729.1 acyl-CoA thioesterase [Roseateles aquatilis]
MPHDFDQAILLAPAGGHRFDGATHAAYANMVGPFGGTTGAAMLNAVLLHSERIGEPIALTVNFASPLADGAFEIEACPARTNRSTQHWQIELTQNGEVAATGSAVFAQRRETWSATEAQLPPDIPPASALRRMSQAGFPAWVSRYNMRFLPGFAPGPFTGEEQDHSISRFWVRDEPPRPLDFPSLAAICDCFFPRIFIRRRRPAPIGTVTLTTYFHADTPLLAQQGDRHVLGLARGLNFRNGYFDQTAEVWSDDGHMLASTHQMVYFKE